MSPSRLADLIISALCVLISLPLMAIVGVAIWVSDGKSPVYWAPRVGLHGKAFTMLKFRTMVVGAAELGGSSTSNGDARITRVGAAIRLFKLDELLQFFNVLRGDMSLVGPRPNVQWAVDTYSSEEEVLLSVRPGMTDLASVVFMDEGAVLASYDDPELAYEQLVRPYKNALGLLYARNNCLRVYLQVLSLTAFALVAPQRARQMLSSLVRRLGGGPGLAAVCLRKHSLGVGKPPGWADVVRFVGEKPSS